MIHPMTARRVLTFELREQPPWPMIRSNLSASPSKSRCRDGTRPAAASATDPSVNGGAFIMIFLDWVKLETRMQVPESGGENQGLVMRRIMPFGGLISNHQADNKVCTAALQFRETELSIYQSTVFRCRWLLPMGARYARSR
jgi:hypothetical protein